MSEQTERRLAQWSTPLIAAVALTVMGWLFNQGFADIQTKINSNAAGVAANLASINSLTVSVAQTQTDSTHTREDIREMKQHLRELNETAREIQNTVRDYTHNGNP